MKMREHSLFPAPVPTVLRLSNLSDHKAKPNPEHPLGPLGLRHQEGPQRVEFTLTMEETMSSRLVPEMKQKTPHHCSANSLTAGDLGPGLPRSEQGQKEAPQAPFNNPTRTPPSMRWMLTRYKAWPLYTTA